MGQFHHSSALRKAYNGPPKSTPWDRLSGYAHHLKSPAVGRGQEQTKFSLLPLCTITYPRAQGAGDPCPLLVCSPTTPFR